MQIKIENLSYSYYSPFSPPRVALRDVSITIPPREIVAIVGATGSGKTTLIQHINGLLQPTEGRIWIGSKDITRSKLDLAWVRQIIGLVFQFPEDQLFEETVFDDVAFGPRHFGLRADEVEKRVCGSLAMVGLDAESFRKRSPFHLSGGEKRRVAIAGVLAMDPRVLVMDEPTVALDGRSASMVEEMILRYHDQGKTAIFVSHDMDLVSRLARRVVVLKEGRVLFEGPKAELFQDTSILNHAELMAPQVYRFMLKMRSMGYSVRTDVFTVKEAEQEIKRALRKKDASSTCDDL
ncbi:MAG: energy-coupling factor transporter ATPase [bacterium]